MPSRVYGLKRNGRWLKKELPIGAKLTEQSAFTSDPKRAWTAPSTDKARDKRFAILNVYGFATTIAVIHS
jgi:hypothetical protein